MSEKEITVEELMSLDDLGEVETDNVVIPMSVEGLFDEDGAPLIKYDMKEFGKGVKEASIYAGFLTAMMNTGLTEASAMQVFEAYFTERIYPQQAKLQLELAKIEGIKLEAQSI